MGKKQKNRTHICSCLLDVLHGNELLDVLVLDQHHVVRICSCMRPQLLGLRVVHTAYDYPWYARSSFPSRVAAAARIYAAASLQKLSRMWQGGVNKYMKRPIIYYSMES